MPLIDSTSLTSLFENNGFLGIVNSIFGDALRNYSIIALGIAPTYRFDHRAVIADGYHPCP